ncbi:pectinesterase/pectinesterase inhibitor 46 [Tripterygium wilfordii]|uniref:Pectinesterase n=1 Tax=Tripterygium wilfordii TaxID=458696 RepID=A0A7J7D826_TRIWF|nr:probable pectinesterase/pectinesterase inhibitor 46 [Tripterygium wilfordii]KAF5742482.1 pectinesterase/pectinesterase inhibitor 46 [Tripterygium wilfordii]
MMNTSSFKDYGKINEADQARLEARRRTRKRIAIISLSSIVLVAIVVAAVVGASLGKDGGGGDKASTSSLSTSVKAVCDVTLYKDSCYSSLGSVLANDSTTPIQPEELFKLSIQVAKNELSKAQQHFSKDNILSGVNDVISVAAFDNCLDLLSLALDHLDDSLSSSVGSVLDVLDDLKTWLSSTYTYLQTCVDGFDEVKIKASVQDYLKSSSELSSNSLAIVTWISKVASAVKLRRLMSFSEPEWANSHDRMLLQSLDLKKKADAVVAKDGSGKYRTIGDALKAVPDKSKKRLVIYVKKGVYVENVRVEKEKWNVTIVGDGMNSTIVSGSKNFIDGTPTFSSATFAVFGKGFIARDIGIRNAAGPSKHQAVALMSTADQSIFYRCNIDAYQDSLYAHSNRQFYRECNIYGTVDFIFGNSAVVIQNCNILPKRPMPGQQNTITAQGKVDINQNTGISIQNCTIRPFEDMSSVQTYLGRPWKNYSTTVYMSSMMNGFIDPQGWLPWTGNTAPSTIYYAEFQNSGQGSSTQNRVKWKGLRSITHKDASKFTVQSLLQGQKWIGDAGVSYKPGL